MAKLITLGGVKGVFVALLTNNGEVDCEAMAQNCLEQSTAVAAEIATDFDSVAAEVNTYLLGNPGLRTIPTSKLVRGIWETRVENGDYAKKEGETAEQHRARKDAAFTRLEEVLPEYVKSATDRFHTGRKMGIAIRFVEGESQKDKDGNVVYNAAQEEIQALRHSDEEWAKITAVKEKAETPAATPSAPAAK